jgi:hypothetical protein
MRSGPTASQSRAWWYWLLLVPFVALLWVPLYASGEPALAGIPYFYWYQFLWILISAIITALVYFATREPGEARPETDTTSPATGAFK